MSADWFLRGALTRIGDTFDRITGRKWVPSSSLATSELIERTKRLLDSEAKQVPGKGLVVPHNIKLKMQWDKFSTDSEETLAKLQEELLIAAADHINDSLYYTYAPLNVEVKPDYFTEGVKLFVSFEKFADDEDDAELNVTMTGVVLETPVSDPVFEPSVAALAYVFHYSYNGYPREKLIDFTTRTRVSIGRTANNDLVLDDPSVSKIHAALVVEPSGNLSVADTGSTNGTFINGERISYGKASKLMAGDRLKFGTVEVSFEKVSQSEGVDASEEPDDEVQPSSKVLIDGFEFTQRPAREERPVPADASDLGNDDTAKIEPETDLSDDVTETDYSTVLNEKDRGHEETSG